MNAQKLTQKSLEAVQAAHAMAVEHSNAEVQQEHLLHALLAQPDGLIGSLLAGMGADVPALTAACEKAVSRLPGVSGPAAENVYLSRELDAALTAAEKRAAKMNDEYVSVEHLFLGLLEKPGAQVRRLFESFGVAEKPFLAQLQRVRGSARVQSDNPESTYDVLKKYGQDLVELARSQKLDPVIGRDDEIRNVIRILSRKTKNNPCLIGEPGVGKTAIAEGLAQKIADKDVPYKLQNKEVYLMDLTALVAGTQFRGQFESRMKGLIEEVKKLGNIILVIDEVHNLVGAGDAEGSMNAANILKPALSRGEIQVIGATTFNEYRKHIEKDAALERRFQPVTVAEPTIEQSIAIIRGISLNEIEFRDLGRVVWKEIRVSVLCGVCLAIACFAKIIVVDMLLLKSESVTYLVAFVVCATMAVTVCLAKIVGSTLPLLAKKLGFDPAVMASPIITTIVDFLSLLVYFAFATAMLGIG